MQLRLPSAVSGRETWTIKMVEDKKQAAYSCRKPGSPRSRFTSNGQNILFVDNVKYLFVVFDRRNAWRIDTQAIEAKDFRVFIGVCSIFRNKQLRSDVRLNVHKTLIRSVMTCSCPVFELSALIYLFKLQSLQDRVLCVSSCFADCTRDMRFACGLQNSVRVWFRYKIMQAASRKTYRTMRITRQTKIEAR
jgi:hypothetical protein